jgi:hypothetical protein
MCIKCFRTSPEVKPTSSIDRRDFLTLSGTGLAGALLLGSARARVLAQTRTSLRSELESAAAKYKVPKELLMAMGYVNTLWEMPPPGASDYVPGDIHGRGTYGIMQLLQTPWEDALGRAAALTGLSEDRLKSVRAANILGGAAVLADIVGNGKPSALSGWYEAVAEYGGSDLYAQEVFETLKSGASATISTGEHLTLVPQDVEVPQLYTAQRGRADYRRAVWRPAYGGNYTQRNRGAAEIDFIVIHIAQGSYSGTISWFSNPKSNVSAHYVVGRTGKVAQCVHNEDVAWHAGNWRYNKKSIGIEHAGYAGNRWPRRMYHSSARLSAYLSRRFNIPVNHHIMGHRAVPGVATRCPGPYFDRGRYLRLVRYYR